MKKNYLFAMLFVLSLANINAQIDIDVSFETAEGYSLGLIEGQNGWITNPDASSFMVISDTESTDGSQSLYFQGDPNGPLPGNAIAPAVLDLVGLTGNITYSADVFIEAENGTNDSEFNIIVQSIAEQLLTARVAFFGGDILVVNTNPADPNTLTFQLAGTYITEQWFELKMELNFDAGTIVYSVDDVEIFTGDAFGGQSIDQFLFFSSFNQTGAYIDDIKFESETLSVDSENAISFSVYPNPTTDVLNIQSANTLDIQNISIMDMSGKQSKATFNNNQVDVSHLQSGMYILNVETDQGNESIKFLKQ
jgi:hypothetical protein